VSSTASSDDREIPVAAWFLALAALGLLLRAWLPNEIQFGIDEGIASSLATQIAHGHSFPLAGVRTSFGFLNPPTYPYLLAPLFALTRDPALVALLPMILGAVAVVLVGDTANLLAGKRAGLLAAIIMAVCPNAVEHSRRLWGHDLQVFLGALAIWGAMRAWQFAKDGRGHPNRWLALSLGAAAVAQTCHLSGVLFWIPGLVVASAGGRRYAKGVAAGIAVAAALYAPWLIDQARGGWPDVAIIVGAISGGAATTDLGHPVPPVAAWLLVLGNAWNNDLLGEVTAFQVTPILAVLVTLAGIITMSFALAGGAVAIRNRHVGGIALAALLLATPLLFGVLFRAVVPPYLLPALVPAALLAALAMDRLLDARHAWIVAVALGVYTISSLGYTVHLRLALALGEGTSVSLGEKKSIVRTVDLLSQGGRFRLMQGVRAPETGVDVAYIYLFHWRQIGDRYTTRNPERLFVLTSALREELPPQATALLEQYLVGNTDHLAIHELPSEAWPAWFDLLNQIHKGAPQPE
jgi:4-amino-4-deoxy-L-arabinose transferase-like glycosyltransferase